MIYLIQQPIPRGTHISVHRDLKKVPEAIHDPSAHIFTLSQQEFDALEDEKGILSFVRMNKGISVSRLLEEIERRNRR